MQRILTTLLGAALAAATSAQEIPGVRATLSTPRSTVGASGNVDLRLLIEVKQDAEVPADLLTGVTLDVKVNDAAAPRIDTKGKGGAVALAAGTRIERTLTLPAAQFAANADATSFTVVEVAWTGLAGVNCLFKVAPDNSKIDLATLDMSKTKVVLVTNHGEMTLTFRPDKAPKHVENFLRLCKQGFYDGTKFHRVIRNFMIQGGDPLTKDDSKMAQWGQGDPGFTVNAEFSDMKHVRGVLSAARKGNDVNSASSQFFIIHKDAPGLDNQYSAFGNLESGADTLDSIANVRCNGDGSNISIPVEPVILHAAVILPVKK